MKNKPIEIFCCLVFLILTCTLTAQEIKTSPSVSTQIKTSDSALPIFFHTLGSEEDLPKKILNVLRDRKGFLWINSDDGIYRYDGIDIKKIDYNSQDTTAPVVNKYHHLFLGKSDTLWAVGSYSQLCYFDPIVERFKAVPMKYWAQKMDSPRLYNILEDSRGMIWGAYLGHGLNTINPSTGELSKAAINKHLPEDFNEVPLIIEDSQGNIWGISKSLFCLSFKKGTREIENVTYYPQFTFNRSPSPEQELIGVITEDSLGYIWAAGRAGILFKINPKTQTVERFEDDHYQNAVSRRGVVTALMVAKNGKIWMSISNSGICIFDPNTTQFRNLQFNKFDPLSINNNAVLGIYQDEEGIMWVSTNGGGLNYYDSNAAQFGHFRSIPNESSALSGNRVQAFYEDIAGNMWVGTDEILNKFNRQTGQFQHYDAANGLLKNPFSGVLSIFEDTTNPPLFKDKMWIGTSKGLLTFNSETGLFSKLRFPDGASKSIEINQIRHITQSKNGTIWVNTFHPHRIFEFNENAGVFQEIKLLAHESDGRVAFVFLDQQQNFWIYSHEKGLFKLDLNTGEQTLLNIQTDESHGFEPSIVITIWKDRKDRYWVGGSNLFLLTPVPNKANEYTFEDFMEPAGLSGGKIYGMLEDENGQIWMSTSKGIVKMNPETLTFKNYRTTDGLQGLDFFQRAFYKSPSTGELYFGGLNGFNVFHPDNILIDHLSPPVSITDVGIFRDSVMKHFMVENLKDEKGKTEISLYYGDKLLQISYAGLDFSAPKLNQYAIQLEGYDEDWRYVGNENVATFTNLDDGEYNFRVKAANKDGVWNEEGTSLKVIVHPPWWATWWAYAFYFMAVTMGLYYFYRFQLQRNMEKQEAANLKEMDQLKTRFFSNITHEFRTPLTLILGPAKQLHEQESKPEKQKKLTRIVNNANNLMSLINQLLDLSKLESRQMTMEIKHGDIVEYTQELVDFFRPLIQQKKQKIHFFSNQEIWETNFDQRKWDKIVINLLSNAIKFTQEEGKIELRLTKLTNPEFIHLEIKDNGKGIEKENLGQIFNRFYQIDDSTTRHQEGTGIGLSLVKELVELQGGEIQVQSEIGKGTTFEIKIPALQSQEKVGKLEQNSLNNTLISVEEKTTEVIEQPSNSEELLEVLIIEDNAEMRDYICSCLDQTKYRFTMANDGEQGIEKAFETIPDLIISDVMMPKKDGFQVVTSIREHLPTSHIPVVLLTAKAALESRLEGLARGTDAYLTKPFSPEELVLRVQKLIELRQSLQKRYESPIDESDMQTPIFQKEDVFITNLKAYIIKNIDKSELTIVDISAHFFMSRVQLYRKLKALTNESATAFVQKVRLEVAVKLIKNKELSLSEIAYQTGFSSPSYFSTVFKKVYGKMPSEV